MSTQSKLLKPAVNSTAFLKVGLYGFQGSGKTYTATDIAIGMCKLMKKDKVAFFDTEKGSDFHIKRFKDAGIRLDVIKSRTFVDLLATIKEAEEGEYGFLIIDSITHVWRELSDSYLRTKQERVARYQNNGKKPIVNLTMKDWMVLKTEWGQFADAFVNSKVGIAACGRAGFEYDVSEDEEGKQEIVKSGTKMKAEGEFGYESDLLLEMYKVPVAELTKNKKAKGFINRCIVLKDRTDKMNAVVIDKPKFKDFMPIIKDLNIGGEHLGVDTSRNSEQVFGTDPDYSTKEREKRKDIQLERLQETLILAGLDGTSADAKKRRTEALIQIFGTSAKTSIESLSPHVLEEKVNAMKVYLGLAKEEQAPPVVDTTEQLPF